MITYLLERMYESGPLGQIVSTGIVAGALYSVVYYILNHVVVVIK